MVLLLVDIDIEWCWSVHGGDVIQGIEEVYYLGMLIEIGGERLSGNYTNFISYMISILNSEMP